MWDSVLFEEHLDRNPVEAADRGHTTMLTFGADAPARSSIPLASTFERHGVHRGGAMVRRDPLLAPVRVVAPTALLAMQKVEGSNPFSRFHGSGFRKPHV